MPGQPRYNWALHSDLAAVCRWRSASTVKIPGRLSFPRTNLQQPGLGRTFCPVSLAISRFAPFSMTRIARSYAAGMLPITSTCLTEENSSTHILWCCFIHSHSASCGSALSTIDKGLDDVTTIWGGDGILQLRFSRADPMTWRL